MKKHLYLNDVDLGNYGIYISSDTYLNAPQISYQEYEIPGKTGNVIQYDKRFKNVVRKFDCYVHDTANVRQAILAVKRVLYNNSGIGYVKIVSDYDPGLYQYGYLAQEIQVTPFNDGQTATFELYFSCNPEKYFTASSSRVTGTFSPETYYVDTLGVDKLGFMFAYMDEADIPKEKMFNIFRITSAMSDGDVVTDITASFGDGFIMLIKALGSYSILDPDTLYIDLAYSTNGTVSHSGFTVDNTPYVLVIVPAVDGNLRASCKVNGTTSSINKTLTSQFNASNPDAFGVRGKYYVSASLAMGNIRNIWIPIMTEFDSFPIVFTFGDVYASNPSQITTWNSSKAVQRSNSLGTYYQYYISIDTETMDIKFCNEYHDENGSANELVYVGGNLTNGTGSVKSCTYGRTNTNTRPQSLELTPVWWTI